MMVSFEILLAIIVINFLSGFFGVILIIQNKKWDDRKLHWGLGFSAGLFIGIAFLQIIPTALDLAETHDIMIVTLIGFLSFFIIEKFTLIHHFDRDQEETEFSLSIATFIALCLHAFLDGIVIGLGFEYSEEFGIIILFAIIFHRLPLVVSIANFFLIKVAKQKAIIKMFFFSLMAPIGLLISILFFQGLDQMTVAILIALSAGMFIYLGATDMLPEITHPHKIDHDQSSNWLNEWEPIFWVILGMTVSLIPNFLNID